MEREEERGAEKLGEKLKKGFLVGKTSGPTSPVFSSWQQRTTLSSSLIATNNKQEKEKEKGFAFIISLNNSDNDNIIDSNKLVSARKLGASLWELLSYFPPKMHSRRRHRDKGVVDISHFLADNSLVSDPDQPGSASLRRNLIASLMQNHRTAERKDHKALQPVSPASYGSSMEVAPYNPAVTPTSSLDFRGHNNNNNLKTSTELIKVLNRIWSLEEQHASNMSLIKAMKSELDHSRAKIKELLRERQSDRREIDGLAKQIAEDKLVRKSKDHHERAVQSVREELEDERRLRKRSESLHRKLAREISETKQSLSGALREVERERGSRELLERLCDEFAAGIGDYEREVHFLRQRSDGGDWSGRRDDCGRLILHVSESWLDERLQMKSADNVNKDYSIVDKLRVEIETFIRAKNVPKPLIRERRNSIESVPRDVENDDNDNDDDDDSLGSESHCFELRKPSDVNDDEDIIKVVESEEKAKSSVVKSRTPSSLQVKFEEKMARAVSSDVKVDKYDKEKPTKNEIVDTTATIDSLIRGQYTPNKNADASALASSGNNINNSFGWRNQPSPVRQWMSKLNSPEVPESSSSKKLTSTSKENSLKAKLMEARSKGRRSLPRASKVT